MKRFFTAVASALGLSVATGAETKTVDPRTIYFSVATINDALPAVDTAAKPVKTDLVIHEDDWRQFEAVARSLDAEIKEERAGVERIIKEKSKTSGEYRIFSEIHVRKRIVHPLPTPILWGELLTAAGVQASSVSGVGLRGLGMIRGGFSFHIAQLAVFGLRNESGVEVLCFELTRTPGLGEDQAQRLAAFLERSGVVLVHWPSASVLADKATMMKFFVQRNEKKG